MKKITLSFCACLIIISCAKNNNVQPDIPVSRPSKPYIDSLNDSLVDPIDSLPILTFDTSYVILPNWPGNDSLNNGDSTSRIINVKR